MASRKILDKARKIAAYLLEVSESDLVWEPGIFSVKGAPQRTKTIQEIAFAAYTNHPQGMEAGLEAVDYYDPPNLTYPFGSYICVVDIDKGTGQVKVRRFVAVDDCGNIINPMIVEGQIHGGLTMGFAPALLEEISYDEQGNIHGGSFMDYLVPTAMEVPHWETGKTTTPSPHHPLGAKGVGESATVGAPAAIANAVVDALWHHGIRHVDIPITPAKVWKLLRDKGRHRVAKARSWRFTSSRSLRSPHRPRVWTFLTDPYQVVSCLPGAAITSKVDDQTYDGTVTVKVGPITAAYKGQVRFERLDAEHWERPRVVSAAARTSRASGGAEMRMVSRLVALAAGQTEVTVSSDVNISAILAQLGRGMIENVSEPRVSAVRERNAAEAGGGRRRGCRRPDVRRQAG